MSAIGRTFIFLNLILSALFVGWATQLLADEDSYREQLETTQAELEQARTEAQDTAEALQAQVAAAQAGEATTRNERDTFRNEAQELADDVAALRSEKDSLETDLTRMSSNLGDINTTLESIEAAKDRAIDEARTADSERDDAVAARMDADSARVAAEDALDAANGQIASLEVQLNDATALASKLDAQVKTLIETYNIPAGNAIAQEYVEATVLSVKNTSDFSMVALNVGSDDKVSKGMTFEIWAGGQYKGQVRVDNVTPNMCSALVTLAVDGASIAEGDNAATRL